MLRSVRAYLVCVAALSLGGCFKHHTVDEGALAPLDSQGDGDDDVFDNDDDDDDDGVKGDGDAGDGDAGDGDGDAQDDDDEQDDDMQGSTLPFCNNPDDAFLKEICNLLGGGGQGTDNGNTPQIPGLDCKNPKDDITKLICGLAGGGSGLGTSIPGLQCLRPADEFTALLCGVLGNGLGGGGTGTGGTGGLGDLLGVDCRNLEPNNFLGSLLCGGGLGGGTGTGTGSGNGSGSGTGGFNLPSAEQCKNPANQFIGFLCNLPAGLPTGRN